MPIVAPVIDSHAVMNTKPDLPSLSSAIHSRPRPLSSGKLLHRYGSSTGSAITGVYGCAAQHCVASVVMTVMRLITFLNIVSLQWGTYPILEQAQIAFSIGISAGDLGFPT